MLDVRVAAPTTLPIILTLPFQIGMLSVGLFLFSAFGSIAITSNPVLSIVGLKISFFDAFIVSSVVFLLFVLQH
ncbi:MAG TPA: hypothetical protein VFF14_11535 [Candidatus Deferrimicrobium sp.]|nr:hypothetical protein [Candidatus Deferrimicrobium sp.]